MKIKRSAPFAGGTEHVILPFCYKNDESRRLLFAKGSLIKRQIKRNRLTHWLRGISPKKHFEASGSVFPSLSELTTKPFTGRTLSI